MISNAITATAMYDAMVDPSALTDEGAEVRQRWAAAQDALVELFAKDEASKERVHSAALGRLLVDYAGDELQNGRPIDLHAIQSWLPRATNDVTEMPYLGRLWRLMVARLRNGAPWSGSDLVDIYNLSAAAGYADVVAGQKRTIADLRSAIVRVTTGARLATSLDEAIAAVVQTLADRTRLATSLEEAIAAVVQTLADRTPMSNRPV